MSELRTERKVVTVLFADLVGFTRRSEELDPEDVAAILRPYHERLRAELERFGGTVEKFIGDAVMALFGAPVAHEDDPERAVRAALAIRDWAREEDSVQVRIAVNTGEALINLGARPESGEGMAAGDVVNTTARLQSAAPVNGVLVGETTYRATDDVIEYEQRDPVEAKGKAEPVRVWEAVEPRSRVGIEAVSTRAPLVGRQRELEQLVGALERARLEKTAQLVTVVGVPGIGKSRLVAELLAHVETLPELVFWRHGRSLPYGEGVTFWALAEMVKAQAGILEGDTVDETERKLRDAVNELLPKPDATWVETKLRPLLGLSGDDGLGEQRREESFSAWRRFIEALAERRPTVFVFEDLHWAGDELLDFVDSLPDWIDDAPLLVLCTTRPEILDRRPGWGGGKRNALMISLAPLEADDTARLIAALLDRSVLPAEIQSQLLARAGGNPLYAEQFVRMLRERADDAAVLIPETVQGIITARLDGLAPAEKATLQHAAVFGKVFWASSLAAMGDLDRGEIDQHLRALARKEFLRRDRSSALAEELQYVFTHVLVRDVAYGQVPRAERAILHRRAAAWIESLGRPDDHAELLAHHYASALDLIRRTGGDVSDLAEPARTALRAAGERALSLSAYELAVRYFEEALVLMDSTDPDHARTLLRYGQTLHLLGDERRFDILEQARRELAEADDADGAAEADVTLAETWWWLGDRDRASACIDRAADAVQVISRVTEGKAVVLSQVVRFRNLFDTADVDSVQQALQAAEAVGRDDLRARSLITLGSRWAYAGEYERAIADIERGIEIAEKAGAVFDVSRGYTNLATVVGRAGDIVRANEYAEEAARVSERLGHAGGIRFSRGNLVENPLFFGEWDEAERRANEFLAQSEASPHYLDFEALTTRSFIHLGRDRLDEAKSDVDEALTRARGIKDPQVLAPTLGFAAFFHAELGEATTAKRLLREVSRPAFAASDAYFAAAAVGDVAGLREHLRGVQHETPWNIANRAVLDQRWRDAADVYEAIGARHFEALARLRAAEALVKAGSRSEADEQLRRALAFWRSVRATRYVREGEALLAASA